jgi:hypothetical protein
MKIITKNPMANALYLLLNRLQLLILVLLYIKKSILNFLSTKYETKDLIAIGYDGTVVNTGYKTGVIRLIEELGRPLQWIVCLFHFNELQLRHLVEQLDGKTNGPH